MSARLQTKYNFFKRDTHFHMHTWCVSALCARRLKSETLFQRHFQAVWNGKESEMKKRLKNCTNKYIKHECVVAVHVASWNYSLNFTRIIPIIMICIDGAWVVAWPPSTYTHTHPHSAQVHELRWIIREKHEKRITFIFIWILGLSCAKGRQMDSSAHFSAPIVIKSSAKVQPFRRWWAESGFSLRWLPLFVPHLSRNPLKLIGFSQNSSGWAFLKTLSGHYTDFLSYSAAFELSDFVTYGHPAGFVLIRY